MKAAAAHFVEATEQMSVFWGTQEIDNGKGSHQRFWVIIILSYLCQISLNGYKIQNLTWSGWDTGQPLRCLKTERKRRRVHKPTIKKQLERRNMSHLLMVFA